MIGKLIKNNSQWHVEYEAIGINRRYTKELPLYCDDVDKVRIDQNNSLVNFEIFNVIKISGVSKYAKLKTKS